MKIQFTHYLWSIILIFSVIRGAFVYHLGLPANITYSLSALLLMGFGLLSFLLMVNRASDSGLMLFKSAVKINFFLFGFYSFGFILMNYLLGQNLEIGHLYLFIIFPIIFQVIKFDQKLIDGILFSVTFVTAFGIAYFYNLALTGGYEEVILAQEILRPGVYSIARIGENISSFGYAGLHHDTANILVMCGIFFLSKFFLANQGLGKLFYFTVYCLVFISALLTVSAANILVLILVSFLTLLIYFKQNIKVFFLYLIFFLLISPFLVSFLIDISGQLELYAYIFSKFNPETVSENLFLGLDYESIKSSFFSLLFGFGRPLDAPMIYGEIAFIALISVYGILPFLVLMFIGFSPLYYIIKFRMNYALRVDIIKRMNIEIPISHYRKYSRYQIFRLSITAMPALSGFLTLIHYGSIFRITSIGLFCVMLSFFYKEYLEANHNFISGVY